MHWTKEQSTVMPHKSQQSAVIGRRGQSALRYDPSHMQLSQLARLVACVPFGCGCCTGETWKKWRQMPGSHKSHLHINESDLLQTQKGSVTRATAESPAFTTSPSFAAIILQLHNVPMVPRSSVEAPWIYTHFGICTGAHCPPFAMQIPRRTTSQASMLLSVRRESQRRCCCRLPRIVFAETI